MKKTKQKISDSLKGRMCLSDNSNWQDGISFEPYTTEFNKQLKELIRTRDSYICQVCGATKEDRNLDIHHIDYNKKNCLPTNLISLCRSCNIKANFNRKEWTKYFQEILIRRLII